MSRANSATASVSAKPRMPIGKTWSRGRVAGHGSDQVGEDVAQAEADTEQSDDGDTGADSLGGLDFHGSVPFGWIERLGTGPRMRLAGLL